MTETNTGSPNGREPYGDGGRVVVVGVTPHQGVRESRIQGEGGQVIGHHQIGRDAKCRVPKRCWGSCVNAVGVACQLKDCTGICSTHSGICWPTGSCTPSGVRRHRRATGKLWTACPWRRASASSMRYVTSVTDSSLRNASTYRKRTVNV